MTDLKLKAEDCEDLRVIAACLQDALIPLSDIEFAPPDRQFLLIANRFCWENCAETSDMPAPQAAAMLDAAFAEACATYERINCAVVFENIDAVRRKDLEINQRGRILELLTMEITPAADGGAASVVMVFAGGAAIRLEGRNITCRMSDIGERWPTQARPFHPADDAAQQ